VGDLYLAGVRKLRFKYYFNVVKGRNLVYSSQLKRKDKKRNNRGCIQHGAEVLNN